MTDLQYLQNFYSSDIFDKEGYGHFLERYKHNPPILSYKILPGMKIFRTRKNDNEVPFEYVHKLSYPPSSDAILNRASVMGVSMFYATIFTRNANQPGFPPRAYTLNEVVASFANQESIDSGFVSEGMWITNKELTLFALPLSDDYDDPVGEIQEMRQQWSEMMTRGFLTQDVYEGAKFLGDLFAREGSDRVYTMTAMFVEYILKESDYADYFDGVLYPSVPNKGLAMNICLKPKSIDSKMTFVSVRTELYIKNHKNVWLFPLMDGVRGTDDKLLWKYTDEFVYYSKIPLLYYSLYLMYKNPSKYMSSSINLEE